LTPAARESAIRLLDQPRILERTQSLETGWETPDTAIANPNASA
jgi:hypothetical protein